MIAIPVTRPLVPTGGRAGVGAGAGMELLSNSLQEKAEQHRKQTEISLAGEQLRLRLHNAKMIRERYIQEHNYPNTFVARDVVTWLIDHKEAPDREKAMSIMQTLHDSGVLHHVCDKYPVFKDNKSFYRFRNDDGTLEPTQPMKIARRSKRLYEMMVTQHDSILKVRELGSEKYRRSFLGYQMVDWLLKHGEVKSRADGERLCRNMLECGIIQHVTGHHHFSDSDLFYQFCINFQRRRKLLEVLQESSPLMAHRKESPDSPFCLRKLGSEIPQTNFVCADDPPPEPSPKKSSPSRSAYGFSYSPNQEPLKLPSVLEKPVTLEELLAPGAPYIKKTMNILGDKVGWGFVARGSGPCYIQAVDPCGPAAAAGVRIRQFIRSVNGINCLNMHYKTIYKHIVDGSQMLVIEVFDPID